MQDKRAPITKVATTVTRVLRNPITDCVSREVRALHAGSRHYRHAPAFARARAGTHAPALIYSLHPDYRLQAIEHLLLRNGKRCLNYTNSARINDIVKCVNTVRRTHCMSYTLYVVHTVRRTHCTSYTMYDVHCPHITITTLR